MFCQRGVPPFYRVSMPEFRAAVTFEPKTEMAEYTFTATNQTGTVIQLGQPGGTGNSYSVGNLSVTGVSLTTASFSVYGSSDGGATYNLLNVSPATAPNSTATTTTVTANGLYQVNVAGFTQIKITTSGTFTAGSISITLTVSPNGIIARSNGAYAFQAMTGQLSAIVTNGTYGVLLVAHNSTIENISGTAAALTCDTNPTVTLVDCGTSVGLCASPVILGSVTFTSTLPRLLGRLALHRP